MPNSKSNRIINYINWFGKFHLRVFFIFLLINFLLSLFNAEKTIQYQSETLYDEVTGTSRRLPSSEKISTEDRQRQLKKEMEIIQTKVKKKGIPFKDLF